MHLIFASLSVLMGEMGFLETYVALPFLTLLHGQSQEMTENSQQAWLLDWGTQLKIHTATVLQWARDPDSVESEQFDALIELIQVSTLLADLDMNRDVLLKEARNALSESPQMNLEYSESDIDAFAQQIVNALFPVELTLETE